MTVTLSDVGFDNVTDPVVKKALDDALKSAAVTGGRRRGGGPTEDAARRARAAATRQTALTPAETTAAARAVSAAAAAPPGPEGDAARNGLVGKVNDALRAAAPAAAVGATGLVAVNNPAMLAQLAEVVAVSLSEIANIAVTSTYSDWGRAIVSIGRGIGVISTTGALQAGQGPVVPFAIATAIMTWRAQRQNRTLFEQIRADATGVGSAAAAAASSVASSAMRAVRPDPMAALFEITERARRINVPGAGAEALKDLVRTELRGLPAARGGPAGTSLVPASAPRDPGAPLRERARSPFRFDPGARSREASAAVGRAARAAAAPGSGAAGDEDGDAGMAPGTQLGKRTARPDDDEEEEEEGEPSAKRQAVGGRRRRKTKKAKKNKRRVTRRAFIKFAY
jgi:hypothetical protein